MTDELAAAIAEALDPLGVAVVIEAEHQCMTARGACKAGRARDPRQLGCLAADTGLGGAFFAWPAQPARQGSTRRTAAAAMRDTPRPRGHAGPSCRRDACACGAGSTARAAARRGTAPAAFATSVAWAAATMRPRRTRRMLGDRRGQARRAGIASDLARHGWAVAVHFRTSEAAAHEVVAAIREGGGRAVALQADLAERMRSRAASPAAERLGPLHCLINNASVFERDSWWMSRADRGTCTWRAICAPRSAHQHFPNSFLRGRRQCHQHHRRARLEPDARISSRTR